MSLRRPARWANLCAGRRCGAADDAWLRRMPNLQRQQDSTGRFQMKVKTGVLAALLGVLAGGSAVAAEIELKLSSMFPPTHFINTLALEPWARSIEQKSNGRVKITLFAAGSALGDATKQFDQVRAGVVDIAVGIPAIPRGRHPRTTLMELPFTVKTAEAGTKALLDIQEKYLKEDFPGPSSSTSPSRSRARSTPSSRSRTSTSSRACACARQRPASPPCSNRWAPPRSECRRGRSMKARSAA